MTYEVWAVVAAAILATGFAANETSHGAVAETMGVGHNHMLDYGGYHCADVDDAEHWDHHVDHMHGGDATADHAGCGGDHERMHDGHGGMMQ